MEALAGEADSEESIMGLEGLTGRAVKKFCRSALYVTKYSHNNTTHLHHTHSITVECQSSPSHLIIEHQPHSFLLTPFLRLSPAAPSPRALLPLIGVIPNLLRSPISMRLRIRPSTRLYTTAQSSPASARQRRFPTLAQFLLRNRVLALYRSVIRATNRIPPSSSIRAEMKQFARDEFEQHRGVTDDGKIRYLVSTGKTEFDRMERYVMEQAAG